MNVYSINPLTDLRWQQLAQQHSGATIFHQIGWLNALQRTYGYKPFALTSTAPGQPLRDGIALCRVSSWLTGSRLISLPFADHCQPLLENSQDLSKFSAHLAEDCDREGSGYVELRPSGVLLKPGSVMQPSISFWSHSLDLTPSMQGIWERLHKNSFRRKIRRAEREGLEYERGRSPRVLNEFYSLMVKTRRRHGLLPQPKKWFRALVDCLRDSVTIRVARKRGVAIAALFTLNHGRTVVYKYGCSDAQFHPLGGIPLLFWNLIEESKTAGACAIDLGRSDLDQTGLTLFKDRLGASKSLLRYYRHTNANVTKAGSTFAMITSWRNMSLLPDSMLPAAGRVLYRHFA